MKTGQSIRLLLLALFLAPWHNLPAQILTGTLSGTVVDPSDRAVPSALVTAQDLATGKVYKGATDVTGAFVLTTLSHGLYRLTVEHEGFAKTELDRVEVNVSQSARVNVKLQLAPAGTRVEVESQQSAVQADSAELKNTIGRRQLDSIPLPTRNPLDLVKAFAGIVSPTTTASGIIAGDAFVNGLRGNATNVTQDGINVQDNTVRTSAFAAITTPVADAIGEFNVSVGGVGADAGFGSAQVSMVTQSGSNELHGTAYWYQRNSFLNANTWFNNLSGSPTPFQLQNRLGGTVGGPVWLPRIYHGKNRTFFFFAYEAYREPRSQPRTRTVMTTAAEQGLFTYTPTTGGPPVTVNLLNIGTIGNTGQKPVVNSALMSLYQKIVPQSGYTDAGCSSGDGVNVRCIALNLKGVSNQNRYALRADHQLTAKHSLEFAFNESQYRTTPDFASANEPFFPSSPFSGGQSSTRQVFVWALQSVLNPRQTNEFRAGFQRAPLAFTYDNTFSETGGNQIQYATVTSPIETSTILPQGRNTPTRQFMDNFAWVKGTHQMRFGGEYRWVLSDFYIWNTVYPRLQLGTNSANPNGLSTATLPGIGTSALTLANAVFNNITGMMGSILQGFNHTSPTSGYVPGVPQEYTPEQQNLAFYWQDSWKAKRNLTLQYGTRWEYQGPYDVRNGLVLLPENNIQGLFGPTPLGAYFQPGKVNGANDVLLTLQGARNGQPVTNRDLTNFAPFLGLAYAPGGKTSIRANFSSHYVQDGLIFWSPATTSNTGLFSTFSNGTPTGVYTNGGLPLPAPNTDGRFPVSQVQNWINSGGTASLTAYDRNMRTPYVLEWSLGVQRELFRHTTLEARYVGNHAVLQYRAWSANELNLQSNGLLQEFRNAQSNYTINTANRVSGTFAYSGLAGQVATPLLDKMFAGLPASSGYANSTFLTNLTQNGVYTMFNTIRTSPTYRTNVLGPAGNNPTAFPLNFFVANPWATNALVVNNAGWSYYHALEVEVKRRFTNGLFLQANYTFSKVLADTTFGESQTEGQNYQSLANTRLDKFRAGIDLRHSFGMIFSYPLPVGRGKQWLASVPKIADAVIGGWTLNGFTHWSSGSPFSISSNRATTGSGLLSTASIRNMTTQQLQDNIGVYRTGNGVYWLNPASGLYTVNGSTSTATLCTAGQTTPCFAIPEPGQMGNLSFNQFSLPRFFNQDLSVTKAIPLFERVKLELRLEAFDAFNNANFGSSLQVGGAIAGATNSLDATSFGQFSATLDAARGGGVTSRIVQWGARIVF